MSRVLLSLSLSLCLMVSAASADLTARTREFIAQYCADCHGADAKEGGLNLTELKWKPDNVENLQQWRHQ